MNHLNNLFMIFRKEGLPFQTVIPSVMNRLQTKRYW